MISEPFALAPRTYLNKLAGEWLSRNWLLLSAPFVAVLIWTMFDIRAVYVALILIFLLYPMGLTLVWFNYALSPQSIKTISNKRMSISDEGVSITYLPKNEEKTSSLRGEFFSWQEISGYEISSKHIIIKTGDRLDNRIIIPFDAISDDFRATLNSILEKLFPSDNL